MQKGIARFSRRDVACDQPLQRSSIYPTFLFSRISIKLFYFVTFDVLMSHQRSGETVWNAFRIFILSKKIVILFRQNKSHKHNHKHFPVQASSLRRLLGCNHVGDALNVELKVHTTGKLNVVYYCLTYVMNN